LKGVTENQSDSMCQADGRTLTVSMHNETPHSFSSNGNGNAAQPQAEEILPAFVDTTGDIAMEVDEHADARAAQNRQREERRRDPRDAPSGPAPRDRDDFPRRAEPAYQDGRYGFDGRDRGYGGGGARYRGGGRMYSDQMRRGGGAQNWRP
jgi:hypothetical protein